ncbi:MAG: hypothetical protein WBA44_01770 [Mesorhizobium sp.]
MTEPLDGPGRRRRPVSEQQWACARELSEGRPATRARVAGAVGVDVGSLQARSVREGWRKVDYRRQDVLALHREAVALSGSYAGDGDFSIDDVDAGQADDAADAGVGGEFAGTGDDAAVEIGEGDLAGPVAFGGRADPAVTMARAQSFLSRQMERLMKRAERGGRLEKAQIDGLVSMSKMIERWMEMVHASAVEQKKKSDEELAEVLNRINAKIVELAQAEAGRLVRAASRAAGRKPH